MRLISIVLHYGVRMPHFYAIRMYYWLKKRIYMPVEEFSDRFARRITKLEHYQRWTKPIPLSAMAQDPKHEFFIQRYNRHVYYRLHHLFENSSLSIKERWLTTEPSLMPWWKWRLTEHRIAWTRRILSMSNSKWKFWGIPALIMTATATYSYLEQRKTWFHDLIRMKPEGLEMELQARRRYIQRNQAKMPFWLWNRIGPKAYSERMLVPDFRDAPYIHQTNSSNARNFKVIGTL